MATENTNKRTTHIIDPHTLKTIFETISIAPTWLSKRFIMTELLGWTDEMVAKNVKLKQEEINADKQGDKVGAYR